jgi:predicted DNA-binding transcriptional regulator AlpA
VTARRPAPANLPAVVDVPIAAKALGLSRTAAYELIRTGEWPTPVFRLGRLIRIPTEPLLALLGIDQRTGGTPTAATTQARNAG